MIKKILLIIALLLSTSLVNADDIEKGENNEIVNYEKNVSIGEKWEVNLEPLKEKLESEFGNKVLFEWNSKGDSTKIGPSYEKTFENFGDQKITLNIYNVLETENELISDHELNIFVHKKSISLIYEKEVEEKVEDFSMIAKEDGILVSKIIATDIDKIEKTNILKAIKGYNDSNFIKSDYVVVWGNKNFIFDIISKTNTEIKDEKLNLVLVSSFNIEILRSYLQNFVSNKPWISNILLLEENSRYEILKQAENIETLEQEIIKNNYVYINLNEKNEINKMLFISTFINNLSNKGFSTINIYMILIIPFLLVGVSFFKHFIGLSTIGILVPTTITLLLIKLGFIATLIILASFLIVNLIIGKFINRYKLHYTPKISLITIINIISMVIVINLMIAEGLIKVDINDIMFMVFFILIAEKFITVVVSKEFSEYREALLSTLVFAIISYVFFSVNMVMTFILAYPEIMLILLPITFIIGKFTGLRATEYFRFREVIKSIEE